MDESFDQVLQVACSSTFDQVIYTENDVAQGTFDQVLYMRVFNNRRMHQPISKKVLFEQSSVREFTP